MKQPMTPGRLALDDSAVAAFATLPPEMRQRLLREIQMMIMKVQHGTAEPVAAERPLLRIVKAPATARPHSGGEQ
jgi:hypothetical protein